MLAGETLNSDGTPTSRRARRRAESDAKPRRRRGPIIAIVVVLALLVAGGGIGWVAFGDRIQSVLGLDAGDFEGAGNGTEVLFTVVDGDTGTQIGERLTEEGVVKSVKAFVSAVTGRAEEPVFQPGTFKLQAEMSADSALDALLDPANLAHSTVLVREGETQADAFSVIESSLGIPATELEALAADPQSFGLPAEATSLEGFLFPATYDFEDGVDARTVLQTMVDRAMQSLDEHGVAPESRWDVVRLASLIQKEAGLREDYYKVSRVFLNRLAIDMPLQSDATVAYGTGNTHRVETTDAERADASNPFNTYVHTGMVAGPISNPGDLAIDAAVNPADGQWLYFVTWNLETGETIFSNTYEEHLAAVAKWQQWMAEHPEYG
nr:endolytic transglycosylase MltG [Pseudoclavibacter chungangensis]